MNEDVEQRLGSLTPRGVDADLRLRVLAAVASRLEAEPASPWLRWSALAVAASLLVGVAMNVWVSKVAERRLAELFGPPPISAQAKEVADAVKEFTDAQTAEWVYRQLTTPRPARDGLAVYEAHVEMLKRLADNPSVLSEEPYNETPQKNTQMDRHRPGVSGGDRLGGQRGLRLDYRYTA